HRGGGPPIIEGSQSLPRAGGIPRRRRFVHASRRGETIQGSTAGDPFRASVDDRRVFRVRAGDRGRADQASAGGPDPLRVLPVVRATVCGALLPDPRRGSGRMTPGFGSIQRYISPGIGSGGTTGPACCFNFVKWSSSAFASAWSGFRSIEISGRRSSGAWTRLTAA